MGNGFSAARLDSAHKGIQSYNLIMRNGFPAAHLRCLFQQSFGECSPESPAAANKFRNLDVKLQLLELLSHMDGVGGTYMKTPGHQSAVAPKPFAWHSCQKLLQQGSESDRLSHYGGRNISGDCNGLLVPPSDLVGDIECYLGDVVIVLKRLNDGIVFESTRFKKRELTFREDLLTGTMIDADKGHIVE
jgi:hypothetical protein